MTELNPDQRYEMAYQAAYTALDQVPRKAVRDILAEDVAACVIGKGDWTADRFQRLAVDDSFRLRVVQAVLKGMPETVIVSSGVVDAAVKASAGALLPAEGQGQQ